MGRVSGSSHGPEQLRQGVGLKKTEADAAGAMDRHLEVEQLRRSIAMLRPGAPAAVGREDALRCSPSWATSRAASTTSSAGCGSCSHAKESGRARLAVVPAFDPPPSHEDPGRAELAAYYRVTVRTTRRWGIGAPGHRGRTGPRVDASEDRQPNPNARTLASSRSSSLARLRRRARRFLPRCRSTLPRREPLATTSPMGKVEGHQSPAVPAASPRKVAGLDAHDHTTTIDG